MTAFNPFTGRPRKKAVRRCNVWSRGVKSLSAKALSFVVNVQRRLRFHLNEFVGLFYIVPILMFLRKRSIKGKDIIADAIRGVLATCIFHLSATQHYIALDAFVGDLDEDEERHQRHQIPQRFHRIDDFVDDAHARMTTNFTKHELKVILDKFELPLSYDGYVRVLYYTDNDTGTRKYYKFDPEELMLYSLIKVKEGDSHLKMAKSTFGGSDGGRRWSYGYKFFLEHVTNRYRHLIGVEGLKRWIPHFPRFAKAICQHIAKPKLYIPDDDDPYIIDVDATHFDPDDFNIALFFDGVFFPTAKPLSGPASDGVGTTRKVGAQLAQQAIYGHKGHGLLMLSFMMPNGIHCWYGPVSARRNENHILLWSGLDELLYEIQTRVSDQIYTAYGDQIFKNDIYRCIKICHQDKPFTNEQRLENRVLNRARVSIEWDYGRLKDLFKESTRKDSKKLVTDTGAVANELLFEGLLKNIHCCFNGNGCSAVRTFNCASPSIDEYLYAIPDPVDNPSTIEEFLNIVDDPLYPTT